MTKTLQDYKKEFEELDLRYSKFTEWDQSLGGYTRAKIWQFIEGMAREMLEDVIVLITTHTEHNGSYCDTGYDMDWACRSECVDMAVRRVMDYMKGTTPEQKGVDNEKTK